MLRAKWKHKEVKEISKKGYEKKNEKIKETRIILRNHTVSLELRSTKGKLKIH